ncbi:MAG TPA: ABC transporter permease [Verrucomicrobiae bacterium]|nr:ABC transporter permease [Verrucomicrobiae bacterium]
MKKEAGISVLLVVLCAIVAIKNPRFLGAANLENMARLIGMFGIFSIGMGLVIITGGIDLSVGSVFALLGIVLTMMLREWHWFWAVAVLAVIAGTMALGWFHGLLITKARMQPFIVTLCGLLFYRGLARYIAHDETKGFINENFGPLRELATGSVLGLPMPFVLFLVTAVVMWIVLHRSVYGRYLFAVGRNEEAARYSGVNSRAIIASSYVVSGALAGIAGILIAFYTNSISPSTHGNFYELYGIAAAVLGGCSLRGGEGSILGIAIGTALLQVLQNLVNLLGIDSSLNFAVMGAVILIGVLADELLSARRQARKVLVAADAAKARPNPSD